MALKDRLLAAQETAQNGIKDRLNAAREKSESGEVMKGGEAFRVGFFDRAVNSAFSLPAATGELVSQALAGFAAGVNAPFRAAGNKLRGEDANLIDEFSQNREDMLETFPLKNLRQGPRPPENLGEQFRAFASTLDPTRLNEDDRLSGIVSGDVLSQSRIDESRRTEQARELFPKLFGSGETASDVGTLLSLRTPAARARAPGRQAKRLAIIDDARKSLDDLPHSARDKVNDVFTDRVIPFFKETGSSTGRGLLKAGETGLEGALLAAINEGDIETSFGLSAGAQGAGSLSLFLATKPTKRLLPAVGLAWVASEMLKAVGPGEQNFFESKDFAIQKLVAVMGLGAASGLLGAGRLRGATAERFPGFMDAITTIPRGTIVSLLAETTKAAEDGDDSVLQVMQRFAVNPNAFNSDQQNALMRALTSGKEGAFTAEVKRLMGNEDFVRRLVPPNLDDSAERLNRFTPTRPIQRN